MTTYWNFNKPVYKKKRFVAKFVRKAPVDCTDFAKNNIPNYDTITSVPEEFMEMDFSETVTINKMWYGMANCKEFPDINAPLVQSADQVFGNTNLQKIPHMNIPNSSLSGILANINNSTPSTPIIYELKNINAITDNMHWIVGKSEGSSTVCKVSEIISLPETINVRDFGSAFSGLVILVKIASFDSRRCTNFTNTFAHDNKLTKIESPIDLRCCKNLSGMLYGCNGLITDGIQLKNVPRTLDFTNIFQDGTDNSNNRYKIINYIETALNPDDVRDDDPDKLS